MQHSISYDGLPWLVEALKQPFSQPTHQHVFSISFTSVYVFLLVFALIHFWMSSFLLTGICFLALSLSTSKSVQTLRSTAVSTTSAPGYAASCCSTTRPSTSTPRLHRHSSLRSFSLTSRSSQYHDQLHTPPSPLISQDPPTHVDLLDAQGQFRPSDFHARLKASGTRDYGEDVAERNLGQNGVQLSSPAVKAFYANLPKDALRSRKFNYPISILEDPEEPSVPVTRTRSLSSSTQYRRVESTRPASRNSVSSTPAHRQATLQNFRNSSLSIGRPATLQANSRLSVESRERSASPPAISRHRSHTPTSTTSSGKINQPAPLTRELSFDLVP